MTAFRSFIILSLLLVLAAPPALSQPLVVPGGYSVSLVAGGLAVSGDGMAADRFDNVYVSDQPTAIGPVLTPPRIARISRSGAVNLNHAVGFATLGQLATNPVDGYVYVVETTPILPVILSRVYRLDPQGGATQVFSVNVVATGLCIDNAGDFYFGGIGLNGPGLYRATPPAIGGIANATFLHPGHGQNSVLQSLVDGSVLIADQRSIRRWIPGAVATTLWYQHPFIGNTQVRIPTIARSPFNGIGRGAIAAVNELTFGFSGVSLGIPGDLQTAANGPFATEGYTAPDTGIRGVAHGCRQVLWWLSDNPSLGPGPGAGGLKALWAIRAVPTAGVPGSYFAQTLPGSLTLDLYGRPVGGTPFLLGATVPIVAQPSAFFAVVGCVELSPFSPGYFPILDGLGLFGPPNLLATIPPGGQFSVTFGLPPGVGPLQLFSQAILLDSEAPNGLVMISNPETISIP